MMFYYEMFPTRNYKYDDADLLLLLLLLLIARGGGKEPTVCSCKIQN